MMELLSQTKKKKKKKTRISKIQHENDGKVYHIQEAIKKIKQEAHDAGYLSKQ